MFIYLMNSNVLARFDKAFYMQIDISLHNFLNKVFVIFSSTAELTLHIDILIVR
jgi:hypothetical protein